VLVVHTAGEAQAIPTVPTLELLLEKERGPSSKFPGDLIGFWSISKAEKVPLQPLPLHDPDGNVNLVATPLSVSGGESVPFGPGLRVYVCTPSARTLVPSSISNAKVCVPALDVQESVHEPGQLMRFAAPWSMNKVTSASEGEM
jgi:hypothetical protein